MEGAVDGLENIIHCVEVDPLRWCCHFRDKIVVTWADVWRIRSVVRIKITVGNDQPGLHIGSSRTLLFVVTSYDANLIGVSASVHKP